MFRSSVVSNILGSWFLVLGSWFLVLGAWCLGGGEMQRSSYLSACRSFRAFSDSSDTVRSVH